jgi:hypothetical protein
VVRDGSTGALDEDLRKAFFRALELDGDACVEFALDHSWDRSTDRFLGFQTCIDKDDEEAEDLEKTGAMDRGTVTACAGVTRPAPPAERVSVLRQS